MIIDPQSEEAEGAAFLVCMRVADLAPIDPSSPLASLERTVRDRSIVQHCCDCQCDIMVDHGHVPKTPPRICIPCVQFRLAAAGSMQ